MNLKTNHKWIEFFFKLIESVTHVWHGLSQMTWVALSGKDRWQQVQKYSQSQKVFFFFFKYCASFMKWNIISFLHRFRVTSRMRSLFVLIIQNNE